MPSIDKTIFLNTSIIESADHKVVIVLDRSPKFATIVPSAEVSISLRDDQNAQINGKLNKILWNSTTEAIVEFHRVVGDLYPDGRKQLRFVTSDYVGKYLTESWSKNYITKEKLINALHGCEPPQLSGDATSCSILPGILLGLEAISEYTPIQREARKEFRAYLEQKEREQPDEIAQRKLNVTELVKQSIDSNDEAEATYPSTSSDQMAAILPRTASNYSHEEGEIRDQQETLTTKMTSMKQEVMDNKSKKEKLKINCSIRNKGTIVLLTSIESMAEFESISEYFAEQILASNQANRTSGSKRTFRIDHVDLFILNISADLNAPNANLRAEKHRPFYNVQLISVAAGANLIQGVHKLLQDIYGLVSTTVVGIPMKEETQQGQSVNYDVEMLHPRETHSMLKSFVLLEEDNSKLLDDPSTHGGLFSSVRLKWCTPTAKLKSEMFPLLQNAFPITPAHVYNRPSTCLTTFLQNGKNVMLEIASDSYRDQNPFLEPNLKDKLISHYLSKDTNGQLIIHCVGIGENANLHGKLFSETIYGTNNCSSSNSNDKLETESTTKMVKSNQIQPICFQQNEEMDDKDYRELKYKITESNGIQPKQEETNSTKKRMLPEDNSPARQKQEEQEQMDLRIKRRKEQLATFWKANEEINVYDWWHARYKKEYWSKWKGDFEGRKKYGDKAQEQLYPNLKLPPGQSKAAGTGTAGPIE